MIYETQIGEHVATTANGMCNLAKAHSTTVTATFNEVELTPLRDLDLTELHQDCH